MASPSVLKQRKLGGDLLVLECEGLGAAIAALHEAPGVRDVAAFGNSIHILVDQAAPAIEGLPAYLAEHGVKVTRIERIEPTIEDIFVQMIGADAAPHGPPS